MQMQTSTPVLLNYNITSEPSPLQVSTDGNQSYGILNLVISVPSNEPVYCKEIDIYIPSKQLSQSDIFNPALNTDKWQYAIGETVDGGDIGLEKGLSFVPVKFQATSSQYYLINYPLLLTIGISQVTSAIGVVNGLHVVEVSSTTESGIYEQRDLAFSVTVGAAEFYVRNFVASLQGSAKSDVVPNGSFTNGQAIKLSWEGNASQYQVVTAGSMPVYTGQDNSVVLTNGLKQTTTFILIASQTDSKRSETLYLYDTITVIITNPDETPNSVTAAGAISTTAALSSQSLHVSGEASIGGDSVVGGSLSATGAVSTSAGLSSQALHVSGEASIGGDTGVGGSLTVANDTVLSGATVNGVLEVRGLSTLTGATVNGVLTANGASMLADTMIKGALGTLGSVGMIGAAQAIGIGSFLAKTDGYVLGNVDYFNTGMNVILRGGVNNYSLCATGGGIFAMNNSNSFTLPVPKGSTFWTRIDYAASNVSISNETYYWIPIGSNAGEETIEKLSDAIPDTAPPILSDAELLPDVSAQFASMLEQVIGISIDEIRRALSSRH